MYNSSDWGIQLCAKTTLVNLPFHNTWLLLCTCTEASRLSVRKQNAFDMPAWCTLTAASSLLASHPANALTHHSCR